MKYGYLFLAALLVAFALPTKAQERAALNEQTLKIVYVAFDEDMDRDKLLKTLNAPEGDEPTVFYSAYNEKPKVVKFNLGGDTKKSKDDFEKVFLHDLRRAKTAPINTEFDRKELMAIIEEAGLIDASGNFNYAKLELDFHVGPSFWKRGCNETLIAALFFELNAVKYIKEGRMQFNVYYRCPSNKREYDYANPFGQLNLDNINKLVSVSYAE
ncbi:MAG: hypothetical protein IJE15_07535 [Bacteroidaceae bacterium]|nr:hypothetical protein [Bacteroidaceae bacterium]